VRDNVVSASGRGIKAYRWILEVEDASVQYQRLARPGHRWETLDDKIRSAVSSQLQGELGREVTRAQNAERLTRKRPLCGRQVLRIVYEFYETKQSLSQVYGLTDLLRVHLQGDNLESFLNSWLHVLDNLKNPASISDEAREDLFLIQVEKSKTMTSDIDHYRRLPVGELSVSPRTYANSHQRRQGEAQRGSARKGIERLSRWRPCRPWP
jgi:hypothetical protein